MNRHGVPTARHRVASSAEEAREILRGGEFGSPNTSVVIKADGLAAGKGVVVAATVPEAERAVDDILGGALGSAGAEVVIEEFLTGEEASFFALCDGATAVPLGTAQDHKRAFDGDEGPNTGGMGAYSPAPALTPALEARVMGEIVAPTLNAMKARGTPFTGVLYAGLMLTAEGPKLIEYNVRFGDPEAQVLMPRLTSDLVPALLAACDGALKDVSLSWSADAALTVVMATRGYPGAYSRGSEIRGVAEAEAMENVLVFHAGTQRDGALFLANGGRVLNVTATGRTIAEAQKRAYAAAERIDWPEGFFRRDIGWRAVERG
jgi:phosphoribosylamine--glycine ligase